MGSLPLPLGHQSGRSSMHHPNRVELPSRRHERAKLATSRCGGSKKSRRPSAPPPNTFKSKNSSSSRYHIPAWATSKGCIRMRGMDISVTPGCPPVFVEVPLQPCLARHRQGLGRKQGLELRAGSQPVRRRVRRDARAPIAASGFQTAGRFSKIGTREFAVAGEPKNLSGRQATLRSA